jgi:hypothetical protein
MARPLASISHHKALTDLEQTAKRKGLTNLDLDEWVIDEVVSLSLREQLTLLLWLRGIRKTQRIVSKVEHEEG